MSSHRLIGIDYGTKRVGVALSDELALFAFPEGIFPNDADIVKNIVGLCKENGVKTVVVGESKDFKGNDNSIMPEVRALVTELEKHHLHVVLEPEIMSTIQAERLQGTKADIDSSAAAIILQSYIDRMKFKNNPPEEKPDKYTVLTDEEVARNEKEAEEEQPTEEY